MTKAELSKAVAEIAGLQQNETTFIIEQTVEVIKKAVIGGDEVTIRGFGTIKRKRRASKTARNVRTGERLTVAEHDVVAIKPAKEFALKVAKTTM